MCRNSLLSASSRLVVSKRKSMPSLHFKLDVLSSEDVAIDGVMVRQSKFVVDDSEHRFDGLKGSDFELSNMLAAGVNLKPALCELSSFEAVGYAAFQASKLSDFVESHKS